MSDIVQTVLGGNTFSLPRRYDLSKSHILGKGAFGVVCTAQDTIGGVSLAVKRIRPYANDEWDARHTLRHTLREVRLMRLLGPHPNIIALRSLSLFPPKTELYMMLEAMDSDLHKVIQSSKPLTGRHIKCFLKQLLEGLKAMHRWV
ncbi:kinase-like domain-containing protein [Ochromonadaceae sp. CCMP2298]|nr:kinase-like domain-containing protein [Ochromonadaceae sp. CCMP2298]